MTRPGLLPAALCALALALAGGCASNSRGVDAEHVAQANLQADVQALKSQNQELRRRLEDLEAVLGRKERGFTLEDVNRRIAQMEGAVSRMAATLGVDTGTGAPSPSPAWAGQEDAAARPLPAPGAALEGRYPYTGGEQAPLAPVTMGPDSSDPAEAIYAMGVEAFNRREYDRAGSLFSELQKSYPSARQVPQSLFWQAEANYQQGDYGRAALICQDLISKYPNHPLVASAMLKQAQSFRKLGKGQAAKILLQDVEKRYPGTPEARAAQAQLREMR